MFPIRKNTLSFGEISDHWSREIPLSQNELLKGLEGAWWLGEICGDGDVGHASIRRRCQPSQKYHKCGCKDGQFHGRFSRCAQPAGKAVLAAVTPRRLAQRYMPWYITRVQRLEQILNQGEGYEDQRARGGSASS